MRLKYIACMMYEGFDAVTRLGVRVRVEMCSGGGRRGRGVSLEVWPIENTNRRLAWLKISAAKSSLNHWYSIRQTSLNLFIPKDLR